jgi:hypothetical protein
MATAFSKVILLVIQVLVCCALVSFCRGDEPAGTVSEIEKYEAQINVIVRSRLDEEKDYVHTIVDLVRRGKLPKKLVDKAVVYVQNDCDEDDHGFVYFEQTLRRLGKKVGFKVPAFDYDIYDESNPNLNR